MGLLRPGVRCQPQVPLWISTLYGVCEPKLRPFRRLSFPGLFPTQHTHTHSHTHTHTHPPGVVLRQKSDWHLSCIDLPVADTLAEPVITKQ